MSRWSFVVALSVIVTAGIVGEQTASACGRGGRRVARAPVARVAPPAPPAPPAPAAAGSEAYNVARINAFRAAAGIAPVTLDAGLTSFARAGSAQLMNDHVPHGHFSSASGSIYKQGFKGWASENQGSPTGWPRAADDPAENRRRQIDQILSMMMREGPNGGHHQNIMNPKSKRVGVGLIEDSAGKLYLTNNFSE